MLLTNPINNDIKKISKIKKSGNIFFFSTLWFKKSKRIKPKGGKIASLITGK